MNSYWKHWVPVCTDAKGSAMLAAPAELGYCMEPRQKGCPHALSRTARQTGTHSRRFIVRSYRLKRVNAHAMGPQCPPSNSALHRAPSPHRRGWRRFSQRQASTGIDCQQVTWPVSVDLSALAAVRRSSRRGLFGPIPQLTSAPSTPDQSPDLASRPTQHPRAALPDPEHMHTAQQHPVAYAL